MKKESEKDAPEVEAKTGLDDMEENIKSVKKSIDEISKMLAKAAEDKEEEMDKKKEDEKEEDKEVIDVDKKKEVGSTEVKAGDGTPKPGQGQVKLPQASAGETDETGKPAGTNPEFVAKSDFDTLVQSKVNDIMKGMGITKTTTPRTNHENTEIKKSGKNPEFAMDLLKRAKAGTISMADMNRETKDFVKGQYEERISRVLQGGN